MKKKAIRLGIVGVILAIVVIVFLALPKSSEDGTVGENGEPVPTGEQKAVSQTEIRDIGGIVYVAPETNGEKVSLVRDEKTDIWHYEDDWDFPLDQNYVTNAMVLSAAQATASRTVDDPVEDLSEYGLEEPTIVITLKKITGDEVTMSIGNYNNSVEGYYLKVEGDSNIYLVDGKMVFGFSRSIYDIADIEDYPLVEESSFTHVKIEKGGKKVEVKGEIKENSPMHITDDSYMIQDKTWSVSKNGSSYSEGNQELLKEFIQTLSALEFSRMIEYHADEKVKESYGLGDAAVILTVDYEVLDETTAKQVQVEDGITEIQMDTLDKQYVLRIGNRMEGDEFHSPEYYVCLEDSGTVYTMDAESLAYVMDADSLK